MFAKEWRNLSFSFFSSPPPLSFFYFPPFLAPNLLCCRLGTCSTTWQPFGKKVWSKARYLACGQSFRRRLVSSQRHSLPLAHLFSAFPFLSPTKHLSSFFFFCFLFDETEGKWGRVTNGASLKEIGAVTREWDCTKNHKTGKNVAVIKKKTN